MKTVAFSILSLFIVVNSFAITPADTNKLDASGKKSGIWKERLNKLDFYGN